MPEQKVDDEERCGCGRPLHYTDPQVERMMRRQVARKGPNILVEVEGDNYGIWVPRHYIALHGLKAQELVFLASQYGWRADVER